MPAEAQYVDGVLGLLASAGFYRLLKSWGMDPGLEFKVAMEEAEKLCAHIVYGDADQERTMQRISQSLSAKATISFTPPKSAHLSTNGLIIVCSPWYWQPSSVQWELGMLPGS